MRLPILMPFASSTDDIGILAIFLDMVLLRIRLFRSSASLPSSHSFLNKKHVASFDHLCQWRAACGVRDGLQESAIGGGIV
jgi:hypothetical protein